MTPLRRRSVYALTAIVAAAAIVALAELIGVSHRPNVSFLARIGHSPNVSFLERRNDVFRVPASDISRVTWLANAAMKSGSAPYRRELILGSLAASLYEKNADVSAESAMESLRAAGRAMDEKLAPVIADTSAWLLTTDSALLDGALDALEAVPNTTEIVRGYRAVLFENETEGISAAVALLRLKILQTVPTDAEASLDRLNESFGSRLRKLEKQEWQRVYDEAQKNDGLASTLDSTIGPILKARLNSSVEEILAVNPPLRSVIAPLLGPAGDGAVTDSALVAALKEQLKTIHNRTLADEAILRRASGIESSVLDYEKRKTTDPLLKDLLAGARALRLLDRSILADAGINAEVLSSLAALTNNPDLAKQIGALGGAATSIADGASRFMSGSIDLGSLASSIGGLSLTNGIASAAGGLIGGLFGIGAPSMDQQILDEVRKLEKQVDALRVEMNERFNRIDEKLNLIAADISKNFAIVERELADIHQQVYQVQSSLIGIQVSIAALEQEMRDGFSSLKVEGLESRVWTCLNAKWLYPAGEFGYERVRDCEITLVEYAVRLAADRLVSGNADPLADNRTIVSRSERADQNINFFLDFAAHRYENDKVRPGPIPNTMLWAVGAEGYMRVAADWPSEYKRMPQATRVAHLAALRNTGLLIQERFAALDAERIASTSDSSTMFLRIFDEYATAALRVTAVVDSIRQNYETRNFGGHSLWVTSDDSTGALAVDTVDLKSHAVVGVRGPATITDCLSRIEFPPIRTPDSLGDALPELARVGIAAGLDVGTYCYLAKLMPAPAPRFPDGAWLILTIKGSLRGVPIAEWEDTLKLELMSRYGLILLLRWRWDASENSSPNPNDWWLNHYFETARRTDAPFSGYASSVDSVLTPFRAEVGRIIRDSFLSGALVDPALAVTASKNTLAVFVEWSYPRTFEANDFARSMLYGRERVLDQKSLHSGYSLGLMSHVRGRPPEEVYTIDIGPAFNHRAAALARVLKLLRSSGTATATQPFPLIEQTIRRLDLFATKFAN